MCPWTWRDTSCEPVELIIDAYYFQNSVLINFCMIKLLNYLDCSRKRKPIYQCTKPFDGQAFLLQNTQADIQCREVLVIDVPIKYCRHSINSQADDLINFSIYNNDQIDIAAIKKF